MRPFVHEVIDGPGLPWRVVCVCDADGSGRGVAYTVGLHRLGLPELFVWARPSDGVDPGADWRFSHRDLGEVLSGLADLLIGGDITTGSEVEHLVDAGVASARLRIRPETVGAALDVPGIAALGDLGLPDDRFVRPVGWALERPPAAAPAALGTDVTRWLADTVTAVRARTTTLRAQVEARGGRAGQVPPRWRPVTAGSAGSAGSVSSGSTDSPWTAFGPLGALVVARAEQVLVCDAVLLTRFLDTVLDVGDDPPGEVLGPVTSVAAASGRGDLPAALEAAADDVTALLVGESGPTVRWRRAWPTQQHRVCPGHVHALEPLARQRLREHVHGLLVCEAFADVLPAVLVAQGRRSWLLALEREDA
jgi:hypothetical protein